MTTVESGVAIGQSYPKHEERATAIHEAGHAVCGHVYMDNRVSTRLSIRKRGSSGGHHQAMEVEDRFGHWRSEQVGDLIWGLGAMAAEHNFYGQTTTGVGGDIGMVTWRAAQMVGRHGMGPAPIDLSDRIADKEEREEAEKKVMERFEKLGLQLMHRSEHATSRRAKDPAKRKLIAEPAGPGVHRRVEHRSAQQGLDRLHRHPADRRRRDVWRRCDRNARRVPSRQARDRRSGRAHMARDLIPPASPAGRPPADGTPNLIELPPEPPRSPPSPRWSASRAVGVPQPLRVPARRARGRADRRGAGRRDRDRRRQQRSRRGGRAGVQLVALAALGHDRRRRRAADRRRTSARSTSTRTASSSCSVTAGELPDEATIAGAPGVGPITDIGGTRLLYTMDGLGPNGSIKGGTPSEARLKVIHREALELALYTFRYLPDAESVDDAAAAAPAHGGGAEGGRARPPPPARGCGRREAADGDLLPPRRPPAAAAGAAGQHAGGEGAEHVELHRPRPATSRR